MNTPEREELPELPEPDSAAFASWVDGARVREGQPDYYTADQMRAYGRLCRAGRGDAASEEPELLAQFLDAAADRAVSVACKFAFRESAKLIRRLSPQAGGEEDTPHEASDTHPTPTGEELYK